MIGAIAGDIIGSVYEHAAWKDTEFPLFLPQSTFTDDTVLTVAVAAALMENRAYADALRDFGARYPDRGYGLHFGQWLQIPEMGPYHSWGNGSAMRVSPVGFARDTIDEVLAEAQRTAQVTHDHEEGIRGAQATAVAILRAREGRGKEDIRREIADLFGYDLDRSVDDIRPDYDFDVSCQGSVPESIVCFLDSDDYEGAIRNAISLGGDADTMACIAGGIAQAFYREIPPQILEEVERRLPPELLEVVERFDARFGSR
jgi:ADP-ribosylglycohydrolase